ncbi:hypothetical protein [Sphingobacterium endophyticum]|uniref:hypothetical protein n=1 Tax=Sphingobacterium endophyticum TaxID=2546448 RepID=UPI0012E2EA72|nr:hypothetical protein [Sphingobacterium endophyticum]
MDEDSKLDLRAFVSRYAVWIARTRNKKEATEYSMKVLKDNPEVLKLVLEDIKTVVKKGNKQSSK